MLQFSDLNLDENLKLGISAVGFTEATRIQELSLPSLLEGKDLIGVSKTGTGKTAAFLIPILQSIASDPESLSSGHPKALILAPTRELALQITEEAQKLASKMNIRAVAIYGGEKYKQQQEQLKEGADLVVGTPGRLIDYFKQKKLIFNEIKFLVVDEADRLFDLGFKDDLKFLMRVAGKDRQTALFSATMELRVKMLAYQHMKDPVEITASVDDLLTVKEVTQKVFHISRAEKFVHLISILRTMEWERVIVFCNTRHMTTELSRRLNNMGYRSCGISSLLQQDKRRRLISEFREGKFDILVATDLASRGIDVDNIGCVFNYDISDDVETYVHRIGRTARAGKKGLAINLVGPEDSENFMKVEENYLKTKIPIDWLEEEDLEKIREEIKLKDKPPKVRPSKDGDRKGGSRSSRSSGGSRPGSNRQGGRGQGKSESANYRKDTGDRKRTDSPKSAKTGHRKDSNSKSRDSRKQSSNRNTSSRDNKNTKKNTREQNTKPHSQEPKKQTPSKSGVFSWVKSLLGIKAEKKKSTQGEKSDRNRKEHPKNKSNKNSSEGFKRRKLK